MTLAGLYAITPDAGDSRALIGRVRAAMQSATPMNEKAPSTERALTARIEP